MSAVDREYFERLVGEALAHLYDEPFLTIHPLTGALIGESHGAGPAELQRLLLDAIEELRPPPITPPGAPLWRRYQYLRRRYVESASLDCISDELGIGDRQARRYNHEGIDAVAALLWSRYTRRRLEEERRAVRLPAEDPERLALASELASMTGSETPGPTSLPETLGSVLTTVAGLLESRQLILEVSLVSDLPPVAVHRTVLRQILLGALVYLAERHAGTRARLTATSRGQAVEVEISSRSPSLSRGARRARRALTRHPDEVSDISRLDGVRRLAELQGGALKVADDEPGEERLYLTLPASPLATILLIDDNLDFRRLFQRFLEDSTYRVVYVGLTEDLVGTVVEKRPDGIVLDVMMPTQDGWEVLQSLKRLEATRDIPVIVCSVLREPTLALALGAAAVLVKPITRAELLTALEKCCPLPAPAGGSSSPEDRPLPRRPIARSDG